MPILRSEHALRPLLRNIVHIHVYSVPVRFLSDREGGKPFVFDSVGYTPSSRCPPDTKFELVEYCQSSRCLVTSIILEHDKYKGFINEMEAGAEWQRVDPVSQSEHRLCQVALYENLFRGIRHRSSPKPA